MMSNPPRVTVPASKREDPVLVELITRERLKSYLAVSRSDSAALRLYEWNARAAAATMQTVAMVEVIARNALDRELAGWAQRSYPGEEWFDAVPLDARGLADIVEARKRATRQGRFPERHGKVVAELPFGFWRYLTASRYLSALWVPVLHHAFPFGPTDLRVRRAAVERHLAGLGFVRNRAAHHEPIHRRDLSVDLLSAVELGGWVNPHAGAWIEAEATLRDAISSHP